MDKERFHQQLKKLTADYYQSRYNQDYIIALENFLKIQAYLEPHNIELWLRLAVVHYHPPLYWLDTITYYLNNVLIFDPYNADAYILLAYMSYMLVGPGMTDAIFTKLEGIQTDNLEKAAMIELMKAHYYSNNGKMYETSLLRAIDYAPAFVIPFLDLGLLYARCGQIAKATEYIQRGILNVTHIYPQSPPQDASDLEEFYAHHIKKTHIADSKLSYFLDLLEANCAIESCSYRFVTDKDKLHERWQACIQKLAS